jgi:hypothetical protein
VTVRAFVAISCRALSASSISSALRMMPTRSFIVFWSSSCTTNGFSPPSVALENGNSARSCACATSSIRTAGCTPASESTYSAAPLPARRPNTIRSDSELPPSRLEPCIPPATSPAANSPGTFDIAVSGSTSTPPIT